MKTVYESPIRSIVLTLLFIVTKVTAELKDDQVRSVDRKVHRANVRNLHTGGDDDGLDNNQQGSSFNLQKTAATNDYDWKILRILWAILAVNVIMLVICVWVFCAWRNTRASRRGITKRNALSKQGFAGNKNSPIVTRISPDCPRLESFSNKSESTLGGQSSQLDDSNSDQSSISSQIRSHSSNSSVSSKLEKIVIVPGKDTKIPSPLKDRFRQQEQLPIGSNMAKPLTKFSMELNAATREKQAVMNQLLASVMDVKNNKK